MIDFLNGMPLEYPDKKRVVTAPYTGNLPGIRETWNECAKIPLNDMALATGLDFSETVSMRYPDERERKHYRVRVLLALGVLFERQRRAAETDGGAADIPALTEHPAAGQSSDTTLKAVNEKLDAALDVLNIVTGKTNPDAAFSMRSFSDGSGRFLPVDSPADTGKAGAATDAGERWTVTDADGKIICTGTDSNAADLLMKALDEYDNLTYTLHYPGETAEDNIMF